MARRLDEALNTFGLAARVGCQATSGYFRTTSMQRFLSRAWVVIPLVTVVILVVREINRPSLSLAAVQQDGLHAAPAPKPLPTATLALAFGFSEPAVGPPSQIELVLKACFVSSAGQARALIASTEGERLFQVGDRLPGGSVLRRIDVGVITLWVNGREEFLTLPGSHGNVFKQSGRGLSHVPASTDSARLLREVQ